MTPEDDDNDISCDEGSEYSEQEENSEDNHSCVDTLTAYQWCGSDRSRGRSCDLGMGYGRGGGCDRGTSLNPKTQPLTKKQRHFKYMTCLRFNVIFQKLMTSILWEPLEHICHWVLVKYCQQIFSNFIFIWTSFRKLVMLPMSMLSSRKITIQQYPVFPHVNA